jgi:5-formyltetrahydrofolate cyclo-ligase
MSIPGAGPIGSTGWRRGERSRLRRVRESLPQAFRTAADRRIVDRLERAVPSLLSANFGFYWPLPGEPDLRSAVARWCAAGAASSLPETVPGAPLIFRPWTPGAAMRPGVWNIPVPDTSAVAAPEILLIPCLGFDGAGYRLGHGGGYYDRTLAVRAPRSLAIGIAYSHASLPTIGPQQHDLPMDLIVTERAAVWHAGVAAARRWKQAA